MRACTLSNVRFCAAAGRVEIAIDIAVCFQVLEVCGVGWNLILVQMEEGGPEVIQCRIVLCSSVGNSILDEILIDRPAFLETGTIPHH